VIELKENILELKEENTELKRKLEEKHSVRATIDQDTCTKLIILPALSEVLPGDGEVYSSGPGLHR
jgi:hypothetical protein